MIYKFLKNPVFSIDLDDSLFMYSYSDKTHFGKGYQISVIFSSIFIVPLGEWEKNLGL